MKIFLVLSAIALTFAAATPPIWGENPCSSVDRRLATDRAKALGPVVAKHLGMKHANISKSFRFGGWTILNVSTDESDDAYVFYSHDPMRSQKYVTLWGGTAREDEEQEIRAWTLKNAPGIPDTLARCFAWHVTKER